MLISCKFIPTYVIKVPERHTQTDRETDGRTDSQTTYYGITALCIASCVKNKKTLFYSKTTHLSVRHTTEEVQINEEL